MQREFEKAIEVDRFSLNNVYQLIHDKLSIDFVFSNNISELERRLGDKNSKKVIKGLLRYAFFIELVKKPKIDSTKFAVRWSDKLLEDVRFASFDTCKNIFDSSLNSLILHIRDKEKEDLLMSVLKSSMVSYELPIDYLSKEREAIHTADNIDWVWNYIPQRTIKLRNHLINNLQSNYGDFFKKVYKKIKVKTYLTDRVLTGLYKTNREKRWECHPSSVHFALRKTAWDIEYNLINQICHFDGFPEDLKSDLIKNKILFFEDTTFKCPITFEPLSFKAFKFEIENSTHGKSNFQVGHMNPLKAVSEEIISGHSSDNISWISEEGNRIQGNNSVEYTQKFIAKIYRNYIDAGLTF